MRLQVARGKAVVCLNPEVMIEQHYFCVSLHLIFKDNPTDSTLKDLSEYLLFVVWM